MLQANITKEEFQGNREQTGRYAQQEPETRGRSFRTSAKAIWKIGWEALNPQYF
jgi:hypothetical protein